MRRTVVDGGPRVGIDRIPGCSGAGVPLPPSEYIDGSRGTKEATRISANVRTLATRRSRRTPRCRRAAGVTFAHDARSRSAPGRAPCSAPACCSPSRAERRSMLGTSAANGAARIADAEELQVLD